MAIIFNAVNGQDNRGQVTVLPQFGAQSGSIFQVEEWGGFYGFKSIFTGVQFAHATNHQIAHMLGDRLYLYVFGDRVSMLELSGLAFFGNCDANFRTGAFYIQDFYHRQKLSKRAAPIRVAIDPLMVYEGFICGMRGGMMSMSNLDQRVCQFSINMALLPGDDGRRI